MASKDKVTIENYQRGHISATSPKSSSYTDKETGKEGRYTRTPILYNFGTSSNPRSGTLDFEYPPVWMTISLENKSYKNTDPKTKEITMQHVTKGRALITFSRNDTRNVKLVEVLDLMHIDMAAALTPYVPSFNINQTRWTKLVQSGDNAELDDLIPRIAYWAIDKGQLVVGKNQSQFVDLSGNSKGGCKFLDLANSKFDAAGKIVEEVYYSWEDLNGRKMLGVPLVQYHRCYEGGKKKVHPQRQMLSCLVIQVEENPGIAKQIGSAMAYAKEFAQVLENQRSGNLADDIDSLDMSNSATTSTTASSSTGQVASSSIEHQTPIAPLNAMDTMASTGSVQTPVIQHGQTSPQDGQLSPGVYTTTSPVVSTPPTVPMTQQSTQSTVPMNQQSVQPTVPMNQQSVQPTVPMTQQGVPMTQQGVQPTVPMTQQGAYQSAPGSYPGVPGGQAMTQHTVPGMPGVQLNQ